MLCCVLITICMDVHQGVHLVCRHTNNRKKYHNFSFEIVFVGTSIVSCLLHLVEFFSLCCLIHWMITSFFLWMSTAFFVAEKENDDNKKKCIWDNGHKLVREKCWIYDTPISQSSWSRKIITYILHSLVEKNRKYCRHDNKNEHFGTNAIGRNYIESRVAYECR